MVYESSKVQKILIGLGDYLFNSIGTVMIMKYGSSKMQKKLQQNARRLLIQLYIH